MHLSHADHGSTPPRVEIPRDYNAAHDLLQRNAARPGKVAFIDAGSGQQLTYGELAEQAQRLADACLADDAGGFGNISGRVNLGLVFAQLVDGHGCFVESAIPIF